MTINKLIDCLHPIYSLKKTYIREIWSQRYPQKCSNTYRAVKRRTSQVHTRARLVTGPSLFLPPYTANASAGLILFYYAETCFQKENHMENYLSLYGQMSVHIQGLATRLYLVLNHLYKVYAIYIQIINHIFCKAQ